MVINYNFFCFSFILSTFKTSIINGIKGKRFTNWAKTFSCDPTLYFEPKTVDELKEILKLADSNEKTIKIVGFGHSPSSIACTNDYMISLKYFDRILEVR